MPVHTFVSGPPQPDQLRSYTKKCARCGEGQYAPVHQPKLPGGLKHTLRNAELDNRRRAADKEAQAALVRKGATEMLDRIRGALKCWPLSGCDSEIADTVEQIYYRGVADGRVQVSKEKQIAEEALEMLARHATSVPPKFFIETGGTIDVSQYLAEARRRIEERKKQNAE